MPPLRLRHSALVLLAIPFLASATGGSATIAPAPSTTGSGSVTKDPEPDQPVAPAAAGDTQPPVVTVTAPNGSESLTGESAYAVTWTATDDVGVVVVEVFYQDAPGAPWTPVGRELPNTGSFTWFVPNTPTANARVRVVARDPSGNAGEDSSDLPFGIVAPGGGLLATTLRDFGQPGTQPLGGATFQTHQVCIGCHGGYDPPVEPGYNFQGAMMGQSARDPLFYACLAIANQDAPSSGDLCIRCHSPFGWLAGRSTPTDASRLTDSDRDGVACDLCHRAVDPAYKPGISPAEDQAVIAALLPAHRPTTLGNGQYVVDPDPRKRGPFADAVPPHDFLESAFHRSSDLCGTCHDVSNPVFVRTGPDDYAVGPLDAPADSISVLTLMPLERTYSEWKNSAFPTGVFAPEFAGGKPDGIVSTCQDCHFRDVSGQGCAFPNAPLRSDLPLHDMMGGNAWVPLVVASLFPGETDPAALAEGAQRARDMLAKAAVLDLQVQAQGDSFRADVTVTNRTGHKLPTGYPEGRRMWLHVVARDADRNVVFESGGYDASTGTLATTPPPRVYEAHLGLSPAVGASLALPPGPSFHFALNDTVYKDNRIPPQGFTNAAFAAFGGRPVDPEQGGPSPRYADGQHWDVAAYGLPATARFVTAELLYQTTSREYVEFLRDRNTTNDAGQVLHDAWVANGRAAPVPMAVDSATTPAAPPAAPRTLLASLTNPFRGELAVRLELERPARVVLEVFDLFGRRRARIDYGPRGPGAQSLRWDGRDLSGRDVGAGVLWARIHAGATTFSRMIIRLR